MPDYSARGLLADQAVLLLNIDRGSTSASMSHTDAATEMQGDRHTDSVFVEAVSKASPHCEGQMQPEM